MFEVGHAVFRIGDCAVTACSCHWDCRPDLLQRKPLPVQRMYNDSAPACGSCREAHLVLSVLYRILVAQLSDQKNGLLARMEPLAEQSRKS